ALLLFQRFAEFMKRQAFHRLDRLIKISTSGYLMEAGGDALDCDFQIPHKMKSPGFAGTLLIFSFCLFCLQSDFTSSPGGIDNSKNQNKIACCCSSVQIKRKILSRTNEKG